MKTKHLLPLIVLLAVVLGCSRLGDMAGNDNLAANSANANAAAAPPEGTSTGITPSSDPRADIDRMAEAFLSQKTFRAKVVGSGQAPMNIQLEYVAPDRFRIENSQGPESVIIGRDAYIQIGDRWVKSPQKLDTSTLDIRKTWDEQGRRLITDAKFVGEDVINGKPVYVYAYHNKGMDGIGENDSKLWVGRSDGLPARIEATYKSGVLTSVTVDYEYDPSITIEPPVK